MEGKVFTKEEKDLAYKNNLDALKSNLDYLEDYFSKKEDEVNIKTIKEMRHNLKVINRYRK